MQRVLVIGFLLIGASVVGLLIQTQLFLPDVVVVLTTEGFRPQKIFIKKGQAVVFKSDAGKEFWPASDSHPTHNLYPEFDPTHPIQPDKEWRFVFEKAGVWTYHDHLSSDMKGTVIVSGALGESTKECLSRTATSSVKAICWEGDIIDTLQTRGLSAAFDMFKKIYDTEPAFRGLNCHDAGHILGAAAYKKYASEHSAIDRPEVSYCGYGFYHGFMEAMLLDQGPGQFQKVREYCESLKTNENLNNAAGACYHGIGHATFDSLAGDIWGDDEKMVTEALRICEHILADDAERAQCGTGVFNSLANAYSAHSYRLSFRTVNALNICRVQKMEYKKGCFGEVGIGVIRNKHMDRNTAIQFINLSGSNAAPTILLAYASDETKRSAATNLPDIYGLCTSFVSEEIQEACVRGVISGIREGGAQPGKEYEAAFRFCALYPDGAHRTTCLVFAIGQTQSIASSEDGFKKACLAIGPNTQTLCK